MPPLPGAQIISVTRGDCRNFHTRACSRPPPPITRTFIEEELGEGIRVGSIGNLCQTQCPRLIGKVLPWNLRPEQIRVELHLRSPTDPFGSVLRSAVAYVPVKLLLKTIRSVRNPVHYSARNSED